MMRIEKEGWIYSWMDGEMYIKIIDGWVGVEVDGRVLMDGGC